MEIKRRYMFILVGFAIPLGMFLMLSASAWVAETFFKPSYNLLYVLNLEIGGEVRKVFFEEFEKGLENLTQEKIGFFERMGVEFYVYDVKNNTENKVSLNEVKNYKLLDQRVPAPDGYEFQPDVLENQFTTVEMGTGTIKS